MNLNRKIETIRGDGIPGYNRKINEIIAALNWLMGVRSINGRPISESDQGPVFDLSPANMTQSGQGLDAFDPDGNKAGWSLITCLNLQTNQSFQTWIWTGQVAKNIQNIPWAFDPSNNQAGWIVCPTHANWGTGICADAGATCVNYHNSSRSGSSSGTSPLVTSYQPQSPPIVIPSACTPRFILTTAPAPGSTGGGAGPTIAIGNGLISTIPTDTLIWSFTVTYDGVTILSASGSDTVTYNLTLYKTLNKAGWLWDPSGIPGYAQGSNLWVYPFNGAVSQNTNPPIVQTFTFSYAASGETLAIFTPWGVVYMTG
jgi:hypothetical protein